MTRKRSAVGELLSKCTKKHSNGAGYVIQTSKLKVYKSCNMVKVYCNDIDLCKEADENKSSLNYNLPHNHNLHEKL